MFPRFLGASPNLNEITLFIRDLFHLKKTQISPPSNTIHEAYQGYPDVLTWGCLPSGKLSHNEPENHHAINGDSSTN